MVDGLEHLVHVVLDSLLRQVVSSALDRFIHIHVHELKDKSQAASRLVIKNFMQSDDVGVRTQTFQSLDFSQIIDLNGR